MHLMDKQQEAYVQQSTVLTEDQGQTFAKESPQNLLFWRRIIGWMAYVNIIMMVVSHFAQAIDVYQYSSHYITRLKTFDLNFAYPHLDM